MPHITFLNGEELFYVKFQTSTPITVTVTDKEGIDHLVPTASIQSMTLPAGYLKKALGDSYV